MQPSKVNPPGWWWLLGVDDSLLKPIWLREMLPCEHWYPARYPSSLGIHGVQEGEVGLVSPVSAEGTALVLKSTLSSSCRVPSRAVIPFISCVFSPTCQQRFRSVPRGCPSLRHGGALGCGSPGQPRPQNHPGLVEGLLRLCQGCIKQQQLLIASDISEHQLASCCMERHRRVAGATAEGCLSHPCCPVWHWGDGPGGNGAWRGSDTPGRRSRHGVVFAGGL